MSPRYRRPRGSSGGQVHSESRIVMTSAVADTLGTKFADSPVERLATDPAAAYREIRYEYSRNFPALLEHLGVSLLVSTYQAGKLFVVGAHQGELALSFHNFEKAMGLAVKPDGIAVGKRARGWTFRRRRRV